jgi:catechol-2,3-dioxygenase
MRLEQVEMVAPDLAAAKFFYHEHLGFPLLETSNTHFSVAVGRSVLRFVKGDAAAFYHIAFLIPSNQVQEAYAWVSQKTEVLPFTGTNPIADFKNWNAEAFYFHDPNQNILEFIAHHDLRCQFENAIYRAIDYSFMRDRYTCAIGTGCMPLPQPNVSGSLF